MIKLDPRINEIPISIEELQKILHTIYKAWEETIENLEIEEEKEFINIFTKKDSRSIVNGFSIKTIAQKNKEGDINLYYIEIILYENEDEWFEAYNEISKNNKK